MSANVTTPIMVGIDNSGNYRPVYVNAENEAAANLGNTAIGGKNPTSSIYKIVNISDSNVASGLTDVTKLMVDQVKQFTTYKNYAYLNQLQNFYDNAVNDAIGDWSSIHGSRYDDIKITVVAQGVGVNNFHYYITIIRWY
jgi:hypothetical protein